MIAIGGALGAIARYQLASVIQARIPVGFPWGTFVVNVTGSALLGLLVGLAPGHDARLLGGTAVLGAYTTFSTWMLETERLSEDRARRLAALNVVASLLAGILALALGRALGRML